MAIPKPVILVLIILVVPVSLWGSYQFYLYHEQIKDPCLHEGRTVMAERYPELAALVKKQQQESDQLLASQRAEDLMINMQLSPDLSLSAEDTLKLSTTQIEELAKLRDKHKAEFLKECRRLAD